MEKKTVFNCPYNGKDFATREEAINYILENGVVSEIEIFVATDGTEFGTEHECKEYEEKVVAKRAADEMFKKHFTEIKGVSSDLCNYITYDCESTVYSFTGFDGWKDVADKYLDVDNIYEEDKVEAGKPYFLVVGDSGWAASVVSYDGLKTRILKQLETLKG